MRDFEALVAFIEAQQGKPFAWGRGRNDCVSYGARAVKALTGRDRLRAIRQRWTSASGARRALAAVGGLEAGMDSLFERVSPSTAKRGDLGLAVMASGPSLVVIEGETVVGPGATGNERLPRAALTAAWDVESEAS